VLPYWDMDTEKSFRNNQIGFIARYVEPVSINSETSQLMRWMKKHTELTVVPVEENDAVVGYVNREEVLRRGSSFMDNLTHASLEGILKEPQGGLNSRENVEKVLNDIVADGGADFGSGVYLVYHDRKFLGIVTFREILAHVNRLKAGALDEARLVQRFLLDRSVCQFPEFAVESYVESAYQLGGDYYRVMEIRKGLKVAAAFDVSGKNVSASLTTALLNSFFGTMALLGQEASSGKAYTPAQVVHLLNTLCCEETPSGIFAAGFFLFMDTEEKKLSLYNMGYTTGFLFVPSDDGSRKMIRIDTQFPPLGIVDQEDDLKRAPTLKLKSGMRFFLYSDGLTEARNENGEMYGEERLADFLKSHFGRPAPELKSLLQKEMADFRGQSPLSDDITFLIISFR